MKSKYEQFRKKKSENPGKAEGRFYSADPLSLGSFRFRSEASARDKPARTSRVLVPGSADFRVVWHGSAPRLRKVVLIEMISLQNNSKKQIQRPGPKPVGRWSKPGFSPGLTGFGRVCPALTGYKFEQSRRRQWAAGRILTLPANVETSRLLAIYRSCDVPTTSADWADDSRSAVRR
jgi:hypothetical protein